MKLLNRNTDYAVRALVYLAAQKGKVVSSRRIAKAQKMSLLFTRRILQVLKQHAIIGAKEGVRGGVWLTASPDEIRLSDLIRMFQGETHFSICLFPGAICHNRKTCPLRRRIRAIESKVVEELSRISIADLLEDARRIQP